MRRPRDQRYLSSMTSLSGSSMISPTRPWAVMLAWGAWLLFLVGALADAVMAASRLEKAELSAMGQRGEAWFREHFERDKVLSRLEAELEEAAK